MDPNELGLSEGTIYRAGQVAPPGEYTRVGRPDVIITLNQVDYLPASFDGTVALYHRVVRVQNSVTRSPRVR